MKKADFKKFVKKSFLKLSPEKQFQILAKMQYQWIPELREDIEKQFFFCKNCEKYFNTKKLNSIEREAVEKDVVTEFESKYERSYAFVDVKYRETIYICPKCKKECFVSRKPVEAENVH